MAQCRTCTTYNDTQRAPCRQGQSSTRRFYLQSTLNCNMTSAGHAYLLRSALCSMPWSRLLYGRRRWVFLEKKLLSVCSGYRPGESLWLHSNGVNGKPTFHRRANLSWLFKICNYFGEIAAGSRKSLTMIKPKRRFFWEKDPLWANFLKCFPNLPQSTRKHVFFWKFREIWPTGSRWNRALFNEQKKNKNSARDPAAASARIAP